MTVYLYIYSAYLGVNYTWSFLMELFDTHFHLERHINSRLIAAEALNNEVKYLVCVGGDYQSSLDSLKFSHSVKNSYFTAGVHPHYAGCKTWNMKNFSELLKDDKCVAVGEIGLDYFYEHSVKDVQKKVFEDFCKLGIKTRYPLVVHCRDKNDCFGAYEDIYNILKSLGINNVKFVIHCYTGNLHWLEKFLELDAYIGITGIVTFPKSENVRNIIKHIPDNRLLLETDSPYLAPNPHRGKLNFPKYLKLVAKEVAKIKSIPIEKLAEITTYNAFKFYNL
jgi:TatD DNase family protein